MTQLQIEYFLHVAGTKSLSRSAAELYVSPPAVSKQIALMEQELDLKLFERSARGMELTPSGKIMFNYYLNQNAALANVLQRARSVSAPHGISLHLGIMPDWAIQPQIMKMRRLLKAHSFPIELETHSLFNPSDPQRFESGELDAALCIGDDLFVAARSIDLHIVPLTTIRKIMLFSSSLPMPDREHLTPCDLKDLPLLTPTPRMRPHAEYENLRLCSTLGFTPHVILKDSLEDILFAASIGEGFMIGDEWLCRIRLPEHNYIPLPSEHAIYLVWAARNEHPGLAVLEDVCTRHIDWKKR